MRSDKEFVEEKMEEEEDNRGKGKASKKKSSRSRRNSKSYNKKGSSKQNTRSQVRDAEDVQDPEDYNYNPQLAQTAASLPVGVPIGYTLPLAQHKDLNIPGIMTVDLIPGPGSSTADNSAMMIATRQIYADIRVANSGRVNYAAQDLMIYMLAYNEAVAWYYNACRAYACLGMSDVFNRYKPKALVSALGFDYEDLVAHYAQFNYVLNNISVRLNSFVVPDKPIFAQTASLFSRVFTDSNTIKNQAIILRPAGYRTLDQTGVTGGSLIYHNYDYYNEDPAYTGITVDAYQHIMEELLAGLEDNSDVALMCGDIVKRYGLDVLRVTPIPQFVLPDMVHSENVLHQIKNMRWLNKAHVDWDSTNTKFNITQDPTIAGHGLLEYSPQVQLKSNFVNTYMNAAGWDYTNQAVIFFTKDVPEPLEFIEYSRFMFTLRDGSIANVKQFASFGVNIPVDVNIYTYVDNQLEITRVTPCVGLQSSQTIQQVDGILKVAERLSAFDYAPMMMTVTMNADGSSLTGPVRILGEIDNFALASGQNLKDMHDTALLSLWKVPITLLGQK